MGRVKLARWLYDAGLTLPAGQMLNSALTIDKDLPEAQELVKKWNLASASPVRIDFVYGLSGPLLVESMKDKSVEMFVQRNRELLVVPIWYDTSNLKLQITKGMIKATSDDGHPCAVRGMALPRDSCFIGRHGAWDGPGTGSDMARRGQALYERLQILPKGQVACYDTTPPIPKPVPRVPGAPREQPQRPAQASAGSGPDAGQHQGGKAGERICRVRRRSPAGDEIHHNRIPRDRAAQGRTHVPGRDGAGQGHARVRAGRAARHLARRHRCQRRGDRDGVSLEACRAEASRRVGPRGARRPTQAISRCRRGSAKKSTRRS